VQAFNLSEAEIDAPTDVVWPYLLDFGSFNDTFEKIEVLSGSPDTVGAISRLTKRQGPWFLPPYLAKIVHIEPGRQVVWKIYPEGGDDFSAFVDFGLRETASGTTIFSIRNYKENRLTIRSPEAQAEWIRTSIETARKLHFEVSIPNLRRLAEKPR
jgi:hypothetical protein